MPKTSVKEASLCHGGALRKATRRVSQLYDAVLAPCGLRNSQHSILVHIVREGEPTMTELARALVLDRSALAHNLKPLVRDGYVVLAPDETDGRSRRVRLTAAGSAKLAESKALWKEAQRRFETVYGEESAAALRTALTRIHDERFATAFLDAAGGHAGRP
jgi:DNA-binding MarR family transcriptional regulator